MFSFIREEGCNLTTGDCILLVGETIIPHRWSYIASAQKYLHQSASIPYSIIHVLKYISENISLIFFLRELFGDMMDSTETRTRPLVSYVLRTHAWNRRQRALLPRRRPPPPSFWNRPRPPPPRLKRRCWPSVAPSYETSRFFCLETVNDLFKL
jgi:hypothetical protein